MNMSTYIYTYMHIYMPHTYPGHSVVNTTIHLPKLLCCTRTCICIHAYVYLRTYNHTRILYTRNRDLRIRKRALHIRIHTDPICSAVCQEHTETWAVWLNANEYTYLYTFVTWLQMHTCPGHSASDSLSYVYTYKSDAYTFVCIWMYIHICNVTSSSLRLSLICKYIYKSDAYAYVYIYV